jgi:hypothetical protein
MAPDLNGGFGRTVFDGMASRDDGASNVPHVLVDRCPDRLGIVPDGLRCGLGHRCHVALRFVNARAVFPCESDARLHLVAPRRAFVRNGTKKA